MHLSPQCCCPKVVVLLLRIYCYMYLPLCVGILCLVFVLVCITLRPFYFVIIFTRMRELIAVYWLSSGVLLLLMFCGPSSRCLVWSACVRLVVPDNICLLFASTHIIYDHELHIPITSIRAEYTYMYIQRLLARITNTHIISEHGLHKPIMSVRKENIYQNVYKNGFAYTPTCIHVRMNCICT